MSDIPEKACAYCGKIFKPKVTHQLYCKGPHYMKCPICENEYLVTNNDKLKFPPTACSYKCRAKKTRQTSLEKYGTVAPGNNPEAREKAKQTTLEHLGVPYAMMNKEVREKSKSTLLKKYGVENANQNSEISKKRAQTDRNNHGGVLAFNTEESMKKRKSTVLQRYGCETFAVEEIREKSKKTMLERYGHEYMMQVPELRDAREATLLKHYGVTNPFSSPIIRKRAEKTMLERYGVTNAAYSEELVKKAEETTKNRHGKSFRISKINESVSQTLTDAGINNMLEKLINKKWFDIVIPDSNILIEIDPTYTHNTIGNHWGEGISRNYHVEKTNAATEYGYRCIHIFDWDDLNKIVDMLRPKKKLYARKLKIWKLTNAYTNKFLNDYHLQGTCKGQLLCLGLVDETNNECYQIMTFGRSRYSKKHDIELLRLCTKAGYQVIGGASKLFNYATKYFELDNIISYCDLSKFKGDVYENIGMKFLRYTPPAEIWSMEDKKITANLLRQRGFDQLFKTNYGKGTSNDLLMLAHGWLPVYDCGQAVYEYRI